MILDSFERINRALPDDPAQAIGSAKELVEATAKTVLAELSVPFDDMTAKLPQLIDLAQRTLRLHPAATTPGPDGSNSVKRILGGLISIAIGIGELRNERYGTGHTHPPRRGWDFVHATLTWRSEQPPPGAGSSSTPWQISLRHGVPMWLRRARTPLPSH